MGEVVQADAHPAIPWRGLTASEQEQFDQGYAVFNTEWVAANSPPGRIDGLGPVFNVQGCDACHNSRRRGRGPRSDGEAPTDLVIQLGLQRHGGFSRGNTDYGYVLNTSAIEGFQPEARVWVSYRTLQRSLADGSTIELREPRYRVTDHTGPPLDTHTVLMPRLPPAVQGSGLLEQVPQRELVRIATDQRRMTRSVRGQVSWVRTSTGRVIGRFGWQATEPTVASQIAAAFSREMGLTNPLVDVDDCGASVVCRRAPSGGAPEVEADLFDAVVAFQRLHAVPIARMTDESSPGARLFAVCGCSDCHRPSLRVDIGSKEATAIHPYTDLLLHSLGDGLSDRDIAGIAVKSLWRTAPLWGIQAAYASGQPVYLLHDGRARSVEEAVMWHDGEARAARELFSHLSRDERLVLTEWVRML